MNPVTASDAIAAPGITTNCRAPAEEPSADSTPPPSPAWIPDPMSAAISWLTEARIPHYRASQHQLKVLGNINFYPRKGTINLDNQPRLLWRGLPGLRDVLKRRLRCDLPPVPNTRWGS